MRFRAPEVLFILTFMVAASIALAGCDRSGQVETPPAVEGVAGTDPAGPTVGKLDPDNTADAVKFLDLVKSLGPLPGPRKHYRVGVLMRFYGNPYYQVISRAIYSRGLGLGLYIDFEAGATESDQAGQCAVFESMIEKGYDAILVSPQTDTNLLSTVKRAREKKIILINVDSALLPGADYYVGPNHYESGAEAGRYFADKLKGGKIAEIKGFEPDYGVSRRSRGFLDVLSGGSFEVISRPFCVWDLQMAMQTAEGTMSEHPDIAGFYCSNDTMALGVAQAVGRAGKSNAIIVIGHDGIEDAIESIRTGLMTGTVDAFPAEIGKAAIEVAIRILEGQRVPRVVVTPHRLVTIDSIDHSARTGARPD